MKAKVDVGVSTVAPKSVGLNNCTSYSPTLCVSLACVVIKAKQAIRINIFVIKKYNKIYIIIEIVSQIKIYIFPQNGFKFSKTLINLIKI